MKRSLRSTLKKGLHQATRALVGALPQPLRFALFRHLADCDPAPPANLQLKIADTREELEACFALLHDAYVSAGFMKPDPSGLRVTAYHALPTTTTLCAKVDGRVVGTLSLIREGVFGFPMQAAFDLASVRCREGRIAEISALAIHRDFQRTGGRILFPLMKFMHEYCTTYFDTRHLVIAVNPNKIDLYEALLGFRRLPAGTVDQYDFANGAPAVGATLDLQQAETWFERLYGGRAPRRNLHLYFFRHRLANIVQPARPYHTTNDPVMTAELIDHFFNHRTRVFDGLDARRKLLLRSLYELDGLGAARLPAVDAGQRAQHALREHQRFSINCPARLEVASYGASLQFELKVIEVSLAGCQAECRTPLPEGTRGTLVVELGAGRRSQVQAVAVRRVQGGGGVFYGFQVLEADDHWRACVAALQQGRTHADLLPGAAARPPATVRAPGAEALPAAAHRASRLAVAPLAES